MAEPDRVRRVWAGYVVYCCLSSAMNVALVVYTLWMRHNRDAYWTGLLGADIYSQVPQSTFYLVELCMTAIGTFFAVGDVAVLFLPRNHKTWIVGVVNIAIGLGSCLLTPICLWLFVAWLNPKFRADFTRPQIEKP